MSMQDETKSRMQEEDDRKWRGEKGAENRGSQMIVKVKSKGRKDRREAGRKEDIRRTTLGNDRTQGGVFGPKCNSVLCGRKEKMLTGFMSVISLLTGIFLYFTHTHADT